ncbi:hypothetical protein [Microbacterium sp. VKM Ac-2923]|uniref:hypothetical protein n=1 Tax=Microbacterium sp. VKM Ac-2923 TaxID=2929476 RepID=UPI001FB28BC4|nr:hypothetical protein [Microbacterium sp. VKM Ac-2923]MCJ1709415.1 hypothetical protein [Microbacterium sp. VKM Ac-2923]
MRTEIKATALSVVIALGLTLTACASPAAQLGGAGVQSAGTFEYHADYPAFDSLGQIEDAADAVVEVVFTGESRTYELLPIAPEDPTDPEQNPAYGAPPAPADQQAQQAPPIIVTAYTATVVGTTKGDLNIGDIIEIKQLGGESDGATFTASHETSLAGTDAALVFLSGSGDDPYSLVSPNEGQYPQEAGGSYVPLAENEAGVTPEEVAALVEQ